jgi:GT2 family glycosyltransferase
MVGGPITADLAHGGIPPAKLFRTDIAYLASSGMLIRREVLGGNQSFDEAYDPTCYEDTDLSLQIRDQGFELAYCPYMNVNHLPHQTTQAGSDSHWKLMDRNGAYFEHKWRKRNPRLLQFYLDLE